ncbi:MAG: hypothetical protein IKN45_04320 [Lachnospiraceae bacterium]|nr:hypothetical protein [Lachnospiraceae bacterium]
MNENDSFELMQFIGGEICDYDDVWIENDIFNQAESQLEEKRRGIIRSIISASPALAGLIDGLKMEEKVRLVVNPEIMKQIGGRYEFLKAKDGDYFRMMIVDKQNPKGIAAQAGFQIDKLPQGINAMQIAQVMQGMAIQKELKDISEDIREISQAVNEVLAGQHNDRLAKYYAGAALYKESLAVEDETMRKNLLNAALSVLTESYMELMLTLKNDTEYLCSRYNEKGNYFEVGSKTKQRELIGKINSSYECIHRCTALKTAIYYKEGEYSAAVTTLLEYKGLLNLCLPDEKAVLLARADVKENSAMGVWGERLTVIPGKIDRVIDKINNKQDYYLEFGKEDRIYA